MTPTSEIKCKLIVTISPQEISARSEVEAIDVTESTKPCVLDLLLENNEVYEIEEALWDPFEGEVKNDPLKVKIQISGKRITAITSGQQAP